MSRIILASQSPRRKQLMEWASINFEVITADIEEKIIPGMAVNDVPVYIAKEKALKVKDQVDEGDIIVAADTVVVLDGEIIGKPADREEAISILERLSARQHEVITGVCILYGKEEVSFFDTTSVWFHPLQREQIEHYVDTYHPYDKAGAYAIQEWIGVVGIRSVHGDFYNVMGLPVSRVIKTLEDILRNKTA